MTAACAMNKTQMASLPLTLTLAHLFPQALEVIFDKIDGPRARELVHQVVSTPTLIWEEARSFMCKDRLLQGELCPTHLHACCFFVWFPSFHRTLQEKIVIR